MQTSLSQNRHLILITVILALLFTLFYVFQPSDQTTASSKKQQLSTLDDIPLPGKRLKTVCDKVDIAWLAADRHYWDGWSDKAMFIKADGTFTQRNVYINQGEEVCVVVLLGPTPAKASIKDDSAHTGPKDSIVMFATGEASKLTIQLEQHEAQQNAYFAPTLFQQADTYRLEGINEYRSYFWESPVLHSYHPHPFESQNKLIVRPAALKKSICNSNTTSLLKGTWVDIDTYKLENEMDLYTAYEKTESIYSVNRKVFMADHCVLGYKSRGQGAQCLGKKIVHVFGDNNVRRNLKAIQSGKNWCDIDQIKKIKNKKERNEKLKCACNDDHEDTGDYPWLHDQPMQLTNSWDVDSKIYFNHISQTIGNHQSEIKHSISSFVSNETTPKADIVIVGLGNADVEAIQVSPEKFAATFKQFVSYLRRDIYPDQKIIIKTPQYFCCGTIWSTSWNTGRSLAFTLTVREAVRELNDNRVLLWDVHTLGTSETTCLSNGGSSYSKRNVVNVENLLLWNLICEN
ncbi:uncharacterized protein EV154DRAFT_503367 [Mucor mucedo]|uniref:uncharacterized protein n=1 Tax=Mucor mucedo TaxID=29922 RepID=UPI002221227F|nr:uncharacterized protein EV154DRAFT_503367 [Mucor mucedo]KAI7892925.1 hypothetical protein EV154DRAFT_503367 [Mucor mucedo]